MSLRLEECIHNIFKYFRLARGCHSSYSKFSTLLLILILSNFRCGQLWAILCICSFQTCIKLELLESKSFFRSVRTQCSKQGSSELIVSMNLLHLVYQEVKEIHLMNCLAMT